MAQSTRHIIILTIALMGIDISAMFAQSINGDKIQVSAQSLTVLKFNSPVTRYDFGTRDNYTCQVRDIDNSLVIKTIGDNPVNTNLYVNEGKRAHLFIIEFVKTIDINKVKLFYDYSNLKELKKHVEAQGQNNETTQTPESATVAVTPPKPDESKMSKSEKKAFDKKQKEDKEKEDARIAQIAQAEADKKAAADKLIADAAKAKSDSIARVAAAKTAEEEKKQKAIQQAQELEKSKIEAAQALKKQQDLEAQIAKQEKAAKLQKVIDDAKAAQDSLNVAKARKAEADRLAKAEKDAKLQKAIAEAKQRQDSINALKAQQAEEARLATAAKTAEQKKALEDAMIKAEAERRVKAEYAEKARQEADAKKAAELEKAKEAAAEAKAIQDKKDEEARIARAEKAARIQKQIDSTKAAVAAAKALKAQKEEEARIVAAEKLKREQEEAKVAAEAKRLAIKAEADRKKRIADSIAALPKVYTHLELFKKYPRFVFEAPPAGQTLAVDYFHPADTTENSKISYELLAQKPSYDLSSDTSEGVHFTLEDISFRGVNCFMKLHIYNPTPNDYLVGQINLRWYRNVDTTMIKLYPVFFTGFPVMPPKTNTTIIFVTRAGNVKMADQLVLSMGDRLKQISLEMVIPNELYLNELDKN